MVRREKLEAELDAITSESTSGEPDQADESDRSSAYLRDVADSLIALLEDEEEDNVHVAGETDSSDEDDEHPKTAFQYQQHVCDQLERLRLAARDRDIFEKSMREHFVVDRAHGQHHGSAEPSSTLNNNVNTNRAARNAP